MPLEIKKISHIHDLMSFVRVPLRISSYRGTATPLPDNISNYNPASNPVHAHLNTAYYIACRDKTPVGRIAAIRDLLNPNPETGFFGCFECEDDPEAASALIDSARQWLVENGCLRMIGPATFNTNQEVGVLIEGHDTAPRAMLPYNPPFYPALLEKSGLVKHTDLVAFGWSREMGIPAKVARAAERVRSRGKAVIKRLDLVNIMYEAGLVRDLFNRSMQANWGFIPLTTGESAAMLSFCKTYADRDLMLTVWVEGEPAGVLLFLPISLSGPQPARALRVAILGVDPRYRHRGLDSYMLERSIQTMLEKGYDTADISLIHEDNKVMIKIVTQGFGSPQTRRYRVYGG